VFAKSDDNFFRKARQSSGAIHTVSLFSKNERLSQAIPLLFVTNSPIGEFFPVYNRRMTAADNSYIILQPYKLAGWFPPVGDVFGFCV
jgi:hypothetical protein